MATDRGGLKYPYNPFPVIEVIEEGRRKKTIKKMFITLTCYVMWQSRGRHCRFSEDLCEDSVDVVKVSRVFESRLIASTDNSVEFVVDFDLASML